MFETQEGEFRTKDELEISLIEDGMAMIDMDDLLEKPNGGSRGKSHKSQQKWGKKGRKQRNKDPYGCHGDADEELLSSTNGTGLVINAGKYGQTSYTRINYKGARSAT